MSAGVDRARTARYVEARMGELGLTRDQLAERAAIDKKTVYNLLSGERWPQPKTRAALEKVLGWYSGDLLRIAEGGEPVLYQAPPTGRELLADAMRKRRYELDLDWSDIARDAGLSVDELAQIRRFYDPDRAQARGLDRAFRWEPGSVEALLNEGRRPVTLEEWRRETQDLPFHRLRIAIEERRGDLGLTLADVASAAYISPDRLDLIRFGEARPTPEEQLTLARALEWEHGSIDAILAGGQPTPHADRHMEPGESARTGDGLAAEREPTLAEIRAELARSIKDGERRQAENARLFEELRQEIRRLREEREGTEQQQRNLGDAS